MLVSTSPSLFPKSENIKSEDELDRTNMKVEWASLQAWLILNKS